MYLNSKIYKVWSILTFVLTVIGVVGLMSSLFFGLAPLNEIGKFIPGASEYLTAFRVAIIALGAVLSLVSLLFGYAEFSSMYTFGNMIEYKQKNQTSPMTKNAIAAPPVFYRKFGSVIFYIYLFVGIVLSIIMIIVESVSKQCFIALPVIPLAITGLTVVWVYINYMAKYSVFGDLLEITTSSEADNKLRERLAEHKPGLLRGYCTFLFIMAVVSLIAGVILIFVVFNPIQSLFGIGAAVGFTVIMIIAEVISLLSMAVTGCFYDNLAKMTEHYLIEFKLI